MVNRGGEERCGQGQQRRGGEVWSRSTEEGWGSVVTVNRGGEGRCGHGQQRWGGEVWSRSTEEGRGGVVKVNRGARGGEPQSTEVGSGGTRCGQGQQ